MYFLIDYFNVERQDRNHGLKQLVKKINRLIENEVFINTDRIDVRIYGGWYEADELSKKAQDLSAEIDNSFPMFDKILRTDKKNINIKVNANIAKSLLTKPEKNLYHTYRSTGFPRRIHINKNNGKCYDNEGCPLDKFESLLLEKICPKDDCTVSAEDIIDLSHEKIVDTMITADLIYICSELEITTVIVTNDDDIWPGVYTGLSSGNEVIHINPKRNRGFNPYYHSSLSDLYSLKHMYRSHE